MMAGANARPTLMKLIKTITAAVLVTAFMASPLTILAGEKEGAKAKTEKAAAKAKPYPLDICLVSGEKLGTDPAMKTFAFTHKGQEIKLCCKSCQKEFDKAPAKYLGKLKEAEKAQKKEGKKEKKAKD